MHVIDWFTRCKITGIIMCCLCTSIGFTTSAQKRALPRERFVKIQMPKLPIAEFTQNAVPVSGITLVQRMSDSIRLGFMFTGKENTVASLTCSKPISSVLQTQLDRMYKHEYKKGGAQIVFILKKLRYTERWAGSFYGYTKCCADAYVVQANDSCKFVCSMDTVLVVINGGSVESQIENALRVLVRQTVQGLNETPGKTVDRLSLAGITKPAPPQNRFPIVTDSSYADGAYASFEEFLANRPSISNYEALPAKNETARVVIKGQNNNKDTAAIWGLCNKGRLYKQYDGLLVPIVKNYGGFVLAEYDFNTVQSQKPFYKSALYGPRVSVNGISLVSQVFDVMDLISQIKEPKPILVKALPGINDPDKAPLASCLDMQTGEFTF